MKFILGFALIAVASAAVLPSNEYLPPFQQNQLPSNEYLPPFQYSQAAKPPPVQPQVFQRGSFEQTAAFQYQPQYQQQQHYQPQFQAQQYYQPQFQAQQHYQPQYQVPQHYQPAFQNYQADPAPAHTFGADGYKYKTPF